MSLCNRSRHEKSGQGSGQFIMELLPYGKHCGCCIMGSMGKHRHPYILLILPCCDGDMGSDQNEKAIITWEMFHDEFQ